MFKSFSLCFVFLTLSALYLTAPVKGEVPDAPVKFTSMAHRGDPGNAPENTIPSFKLAIATGVESCEFDVYSTKDGVLVLSHDPDFTRATEGKCKEKVNNLTWDVVKTLDVGRPSKWNGKYKGTPVPTLDETLDLFKDSGCIPVIELKQGGIEEKVVAALKKRNMIRQCCIVSFNSKALRKMVELAPDIYVIRNGGNRKDMSDDQYVQWFADSFEDGEFKVANPHYSQLNENTVKKLHEAGFRVGAWVINDEKTLHQYLDWGVNSITTDKPALLVKVLKERKK